MRDQQLKVIIGSLLHDMGKVRYRAKDGRNHSISGVDFLQDEVGIKDADILDQVRYHHATLLKKSGVSKDSLCYITYIADNISSFSDRRAKEEEQIGFDKNMALESVFNLLNGNHGNAKYSPKTLSRKDGINMPTEKLIIYDDSFYQKISDNIQEVLKNLKYTDEYVNSLLEVLEANLSFVPSSTAKAEVADISLFDHMKMTAAIASCILDYLEENNISDYEKELLQGAEKFYDKQVFLLYSMDVSGIQSFIYHQYGNENVLKNLRSRSFYLEIMLENMIDDLLDQIGLSRTNLIYSGGGHAYLLIPNTLRVKKILGAFQSRMNQWFQEHFKAELYIATGYAECSANNLRNQPEGSYRDVFGRVSEKLSEQKVHRYSATQILELNNDSRKEDVRECRICHRSDHLTKDNLCEICDGLIQLSRDVLSRSFFTILSEKEDGRGLMIGPERYLIADSKESLTRRMQSQAEYIRAYCKNDMYVGESVATKLWVGDYSAAGTLSELIKAGKGISRLGVLRADIDNLGQAFVQGFSEKYQTLSRSATFSRKLSLFFKLHINDILENGSYSLDGNPAERNITIIYSGGDDVFVVGAWKDILEFAVDLHNNLKEFTENTLTISAGFGIFKDKYPISYIADQTGVLEDYSKDLEGKNAITLFDQAGRYSWEIFIDKVLGEKFQLIYEFFFVSTEKGKNFLYHMLDLMRNREEKINLARLAYFLARFEPDKDASDLQKEVYNKFSRKIYEWMLNEEDCRQTITAIYLYAYLVREEEEK